jgi:hypothetical protein
LHAFITSAKDTHLCVSTLRSLNINFYTCPYYGLCKFRPCTPVLCTVMMPHYICQHCGLLQVTFSYAYICTPKYPTVYRQAIICITLQYLTTNTTSSKVASLYAVLQYLLTHLYIELFIRI